jgi:hypothetical protein
MANPFKDQKAIEKDLDNFLRKYRSTLYNHSKRISDFFEMSCYNNIVRFYENCGYDVIVKNLIKNKFRYKCSTAGNPDNFSYFELNKNNEQSVVYEIRHNLNVQSSHQNDIFTTPDISIVNPGKIRIDENFYNSNTKFYYLENCDLITFCEVKNFNPFPELIFNFIGVVNELKPKVLRLKKHGKNHISTSSCGQNK